MKAFIYHVLFYSIFGPFTQLVMCLFEQNTFLASNFSFSWHCKSTFNVLYQLVFWFLWVGPIGLLVYKMITTGQSLTSLHNEGYDVVLLALCFLQIVIRSFIIAVKYATYSEKQNEKVNNSKLSAK
jgi:phosphate starvation-inducible membrane PsiE